MPLVPALGRQRQADLYEFNASLVYRASSRRAKAVTQRSPILKNKTTQQQKIDYEKKNLLPFVISLNMEVKISDRSTVSRFKSTCNTE